MVGQIPIYYNQKNTGKPPNRDEIVHIDDIAAHAPQTSLGMSAFHLDAGFEPLFPFGFGLSYADFVYDNIHSSANEVVAGDTLTISADLTNRGPVAAVEVVQLYVRDLVGNVTRPVRELKGFKRVPVEPGQTINVAFELDTDELAFFGRDNRLILEAGEFHVWMGGSSATNLRSEFKLVDQR
jgi:beta-glucosidase